MSNPNIFRPDMFRTSYSQPYYNNVAPPSIIPQTQRPVNITKLDSTRSRWDKPLDIPEVLYNKLNIEPPKKSQSKQPGKQYPQQLLLFIKRAYEKCSNEAETKHMEAALRKLVNENDGKLQIVKWASQQVPKIPKVQSLPKSATVPSMVPMIIKANKQTINNVPNKVEKLINKVQTPYQLPKFQFKSSPVSFVPQSLPQFKPVPRFSQVKQKKQDVKQHDNIQKVGRFSDTPPAVSKSKSNKVQQKNKKLEQKVAPLTQPVKPLVIIQQTNVAKRLQRLSRFKGSTIVARQVEQQNDIQMDENQKIVGTSQQLEKMYLRITHAPDPSTVRPEPVLKKVLAFLQAKYKNGTPYEYISEQFRSLRQDLVVQHIRNDFTVQVYQQNSKISLFSDDMGQFHQCQSALWDLYKNGIYKTISVKNKFIGYQLLTLIMDQKFRELQHMLTQLKSQELESEDVRRVLKVRQLLMMGNYSSFFRFYSDLDALSRCLFNQYMDKIRASCIAMCSKTLGQKISVEDLASIIGDNPLLLNQTISDIGGIIRDGFFYCKESYPIIQECELLFKKKNRVTLTLN